MPELGMGLPNAYTDAYENLCSVSGYHLTNGIVVNPKWRELDRRKRSVKSKLTHRQARFAALTLHPEPDETTQVKWEKRKAELVEEIEQFEKELADIDKKSKETPDHLAWDEMPETEKFQRLAPSRQQLVDTVKMIAYRAETALA
jgi:hypothetical protein